jgi:DNA polymerase-4
MERRILHLDMDAFYASVEALDNPSLTGKPLLVGGTGPRSVVAACSYAARKFGIHSAMPMRRAQELCPQALCVRPRMGRYEELSTAIFTFLRTFTDQIEETSIDEAYLDISALASSDEAAFEVARAMQAGIHERFGLWCSVGIAPCKFISKIASDLRKPQALVLVRQGEVLDFLTPLDVGRIPGIGQVSQRKLHLAGVKTIADLRRQNHEMLDSMFGKWGERLYDYARGLDPSPIVTEYERKSFGTEKTFDRDVADPGILRQTLTDQAGKVAQYLEEEHLYAKTVTIKVRYANFELVSRQESYPRPMQSAGEIASVALDLLERTEARLRPVRLVGVSVSNFSEPETDSDLPLFDRPSDNPQPVHFFPAERGSTSPPEPQPPQE